MSQDSPFIPRTLSWASYSGVLNRRIAQSSWRKIQQTEAVNAPRKHDFPFVPSASHHVLAAKPLINNIHWNCMKFHHRENLQGYNIYNSGMSLKNWFSASKFRSILGFPWPIPHLEPLKSSRCLIRAAVTEVTRHCSTSPADSPSGMWYSPPISSGLYHCNT